VYRHRAESEGVALATDIAPDLPRTRIDDRAIQLAVINLVDNALKYAPGSGTVTVRVRSENGAGESIVVRVIDRGPGVPLEDRERIFERFVRGVAGREAASGRPVRGSGIGLALVKHIAESHGGRAWVESARGDRAPAASHASGLAGAPPGAAAGPGASFAISIPVGGVHGES
jgi:two-component system phosphate regulon sensor histidine kinase PhoR